MIEILLGITIALLVILLISVVIVYFKVKKNGETEVTTDFDQDKLNLQVSSTLNKSLVAITNQFNTLKDNINDAVAKLNKDVNNNLLDNSKENKEHLKTVTESLTKITESQKNLDELNTQINSLKEVLSVQQLTGRYGEEILENIIVQIFGETHGLYDFQSKLSNGKRPDAIVNFSEPINKVCIDSKFNFKEFNSLFFADKKDDVIKLKKSFKDAIKEEIDKISDDYIIKGETAEFTILFMPTDSIFNYIQNDNDLYNGVYVYARKKNVILCSPSSLQPILMTMNVLRINTETSKNIEVIIKQLRIYSDDVRRLDDRYTKVKANLNTLNKSMNDCTITVDKIVTKTDSLLQTDVLKEDN